MTTAKYSAPFQDVRVGSIHEVADVLFVYGAYVAPHTGQDAAWHSRSCDVLVAVTMKVLHDALPQNGRPSLHDVACVLRTPDPSVLQSMLEHPNPAVVAVARYTIQLPPNGKSRVFGTALNIVSAMDTAARKKRREQNIVEKAKHLRLVKP